MGRIDTKRRFTTQLGNAVMEVQMREDTASESHWPNTPRPGAGGPVSKGRRSGKSQLKKGQSAFFLHAVVLVRPSVAWMVHIHFGLGKPLLSLLIQMLISARGTRTDTPRNSVVPASGTSLSAVKVTSNYPPQ